MFMVVFADNQPGVRVRDDGHLCLQSSGGVVDGCFSSLTPINGGTC